MPSIEMLIQAEDEAYKVGRAEERTKWKTEALWVLERCDEDEITGTGALRLLLEKMGVK